MALRCFRGASYVNVFHVLLKDDKIKEHDREFVRQLGLFPFPSEAERATRGPVHHAPAYVRTAPLTLSPPTDQRPRRRAHPPCRYPAPCGRVCSVAGLICCDLCCGRTDGDLCRSSTSRRCSARRSASPSPRWASWRSTTRCSSTPDAQLHELHPNS